MLSRTVQVQRVRCTVQVQRVPLLCSDVCAAGECKHSAEGVCGERRLMHLRQAASGTCGTARIHKRPWRSGACTAGACALQGRSLGAASSSNTERRARRGHGSGGAHGTLASAREEEAATSFIAGGASTVWLSALLRPASGMTAGVIPPEQACPSRPTSKERAPPGDRANGWHGCALTGGWESMRPSLTRHLLWFQMRAVHARHVLSGLYIQRPSADELEHFGVVELAYRGVRWLPHSIRLT